MIESRCGLRCSACTYREQTGCPGCTAVDQPFWGACPVKTCCEGKKQSHCGSCADFPCAQLDAFAHDPEQGDGGKRIEQCRAWKKVVPRYRSTLLAVADVARAKRFYTSLFGLAVMEDIGANVTLSGGITLQEMSVWKNLLQTDAVKTRHNASELYFETYDMDAFVAALAAWEDSITYANALSEFPWGQRGLRIYDPDGHLIEVGEYMGVVVRRVLAGGLSMEQAAARMNVPLAYIQHYANN